MRKQHLNTKLQEALDLEKEENALQIHRILQNEAQKKSGQAYTGNYSRKRIT